MDEKIVAIHIHGQFWQDKSCGTTYHTSRIQINGKTIHKTIMSNGSHYEQSAQEWLVHNGYLKGTEKYGYGLYSYCEKHGIIYTNSEAYGLKREL